MLPEGVMLDMLKKSGIQGGGIGMLRDRSMCYRHDRDGTGGRVSGRALLPAAVAWNRTEQLRRFQAAGLRGMGRSLPTMKKTATPGSALSAGIAKVRCAAVLFARFISNA
jgi:hypothetical protein